MSFKRFSKYCFSFSSLDLNMSNLKDQEAYYNRWMQKYSTIFSSVNDFIAVEWDLRCRKALREMFSSAILYTEGKKNLEMCCFSSYYFCLYYSLFHAIKATLYLDINTSIGNLMEKTHSSTIDTFVSVFANGEKDILSNDIKDIFNELKLKRECYSYQTPFNNVFNYKDDLQKLEIILIQCYQLGSFHSLMIEKSYRKNKGYIVKFSDTEKFYDFIDLFQKMFAKKDLSGNYILDSSCKNLQSELLRDGCLPSYIALDLDHELDEFHTYDSFYKNCSDYSLKLTDVWAMLICL